MKPPTHNTIWHHCIRKNICSWYKRISNRWTCRIPDIHKLRL